MKDSFAKAILVFQKPDLGRLLVYDKRMGTSKSLA